MNKVTVRIIGQDYVLKGDEEEEYLKKVGFEVNDLVESIKSRNMNIDTASAAVLAAVNAMDQSFKNQNRLTELKDNKGSVHHEAKLQKEQADKLQEKLHLLEKDHKKVKEELAEEVPAEAAPEEAPAVETETPVVEEVTDTVSEEKVDEVKE